MKTDTLRSIRFCVTEKMGIGPERGFARTVALGREQCARRSAPPQLAEQSVLTQSALPVDSPHPLQSIKTSLATYSTLCVCVSPLGEDFYYFIFATKKPPRRDGLVKIFYEQIMKAAV